MLLVRSSNMPTPKWTIPKSISPLFLQTLGYIPSETYVSTFHSSSASFILSLTISKLSEIPTNVINNYLSDHNQLKLPVEYNILTPHISQGIRWICHIWMLELVTLYSSESLSTNKWYTIDIDFSSDSTNKNFSFLTVEETNTKL